ncbi:hypothetical protein M378DRAFT_16976 [Amanita muscaria Koide BX008]|uniref:Uncharacterized protein n=1 Tax=Amanita muscaria (strain Koide BX008) TaxID=946122 RepID=A0A0C2W624_AMAMK|nr:hypothetical protein M378DRAFT_16976 [Amanita muscaria Koide BX008]
MPGIFVKGFPIDHAKVDETFAPRLGKEKLWGAFQELIALAKSEGYDLVVAERTGHEVNCPFVLVLASDDDKDKLEATPIQNRLEDQVGWLEPFLESEIGVYRRDRGFLKQPFDLMYVGTPITVQKSVILGPSRRR